MGSPNLPDPLVPVSRPERKVDVKPEDVVLGNKKKTSSDPQGKKALTRPRGQVVQQQQNTSSGVVV